MELYLLLHHNHVLLHHNRQSTDADKVSRPTLGIIESIRLVYAVPYRPSTVFPVPKKVHAREEEISMEITDTGAQAHFNPQASLRPLSNEVSVLRLSVLLDLEGLKNFLPSHPSSSIWTFSTSYVNCS
eukprot:4050022-Amphidinium_carterae.1